MGNARPIYLDCQATTPLDPRVLEAMLPYFGERFGNPHADDHAFGREAAGAVEEARAEVAALIGAEPREIVFTSGATESNNLAVKGSAHHHRGRGRDGVVLPATEHKCVIESSASLGREGFRVTTLPVRADGLLDMDALDAALDERTATVSVMAANNETGTLQPLAAIGRLCRERGASFHTDAAQAAGKVPFDVNEARVDLASLSAHKMYGPKGIGALYVRRRPRARLVPLLDGGGQERTLRSGTVPVPLAVGFGAAARIARDEMAEEARRTAALRDRMLAALGARLPGLAVHGTMEARLPGNLSVALPGVDAAALVRALGEEVALSTGSACSDPSVESSYVLRALGVDEATARATLRIAPGRFTTGEEADRAAVLIAEAAAAQTGIRPAA